MRFGMVRTLPPILVHPDISVIYRRHDGSAGAPDVPRRIPARVSVAMRLRPGPPSGLADSASESRPASIRSRLAGEQPRPLAERLIILQEPLPGLGDVQGEHFDWGPAVGPVASPGGLCGGSGGIGVDLPSSLQDRKLALPARGASSRRPRGPAGASPAAAASSFSRPCAILPALEARSPLGKSFVQPAESFKAIRPSPVSRSGSGAIGLNPPPVSLGTSRVRPSLLIASFSPHVSWGSGPVPPIADLVVARRGRGCVTDTRSLSPFRSAAAVAASAPDPGIGPPFRPRQGHRVPSDRDLPWRDRSSPDSARRRRGHSQAGPESATACRSSRPGSLPRPPQRPITNQSQRPSSSRSIRGASALMAATTTGPARARARPGRSPLAAPAGSSGRRRGGRLGDRVRLGGRLAFQSFEENRRRRLSL